MDNDDLAGGQGGPEPDADGATEAADTAGGQSTPARVALSRERIVAAAVAHIEQVGLSGLTMRALGAQLGVEGMALYRYVPGKEELLDAVVEAIVDLLTQDEQVLLTPRYGWQDFVQRLAHGLRRLALAHPQAFPLVASRPPEAPWLRPPLRSLTWVEVFLGALVKEGFTDEAAAAAYRAFTSFILGHLLLEITTQGADIGPLEALEGGEDTGSPRDLSQYPIVRRLQGRLAEDHTAAEFEVALAELLNRLKLLREKGVEAPGP